MELFVDTSRWYIYKNIISEHILTVCCIYVYLLHDNIILLSDNRKLRAAVSHSVIYRSNIEISNDLRLLRSVASTCIQTAVGHDDKNIYKQLEGTVSNFSKYYKNRWLTNNNRYNMIQYYCHITVRVLCQYWNMIYLNIIIWTKYCVVHCVECSETRLHDSHFVFTGYCAESNFVGLKPRMRINVFLFCFVFF